MPRVVVFFYLFAALWLLGFAGAAVTAGASAAVVCGALGMLGFLAATAARISAQNPPTRRSAATGSSWVRP